MIEPQWILLGLLLPAMVSAILAWLIGGSSGSDWITAAGLGVAHVTGFVVGFMATYGLPRFPPIESQDWIVTVLLPAALVVTLLSATKGVSFGLSWLLRGLLAAATPLVLLQPYVRYTWSFSESVTWLCGLGAAGLVTWFFLLRFEYRVVSIAKQEEVGSCWWWSWTLAIVAGATGMTILLSGSQTLGQLGLTLAAVLGGSGTLCATVRRPRSVASCLDVPYLLLFGLWLSGYFYAELGFWQVAALVLAPHMVWVGQWARFRKLPAWQNAMIGLIAVTAVAMSAVLFAAVKFGQEATDIY